VVVVVVILVVVMVERWDVAFALCRAIRYVIAIVVIGIIIGIVVVVGGGGGGVGSIRVIIGVAIVDISVIRSFIRTTHVVQRI